jgi:ABC-2 type transport system ATP-binding protein
MIETRDLWRTFGDKDAVAGLDLNIAEGEIYGFLGPNGAGKTTSLRMLSGLLEPSRGEISIADMSYERHPYELRRITGLVPDTPPLFEYLTGRQYVAFVASLYGVTKSQRDDEAERLFGLLDLTDRADRLCKGYSHGMKKKIHLAAVLTTRPRVLFLDEPSTGLDPRSARALKDLVRETRDRGTTIMLSTHILETAQELSDRIGILASGRLRAEGTLSELRARSENDSLEDIFLSLTSDAARDHAERVSG